MQRLRAWDLRLSRLPRVLGLCADDTPRIYDYVNTAQRRLLYAKEAADESWWGTWAEIAFTVNPATPYITMPREVARLEAVNVCNRPVAVQNQFYEYLEFGNGRFPKLFRCRRGIPPVQVFSRNNVPVFSDLVNPPKKIAVYITEAQDAGKRILLQGLDQNGVPIYSQDVFSRVKGIFLNLALPVVFAPINFNEITGIQKDPTAGQVQIFQVDINTGEQSLMLTMEPSETTGWYRRYFLNQLPCGCCPPTGLPTNCQQVLVSALVKLDLIPVSSQTDYTLLQNMEAIIEECQSARYSEIDTTQAKQEASYHHKEAISHLNAELTHYLGTNQPAVQFAPFGSARLECLRIGSML